MNFEPRSDDDLKRVTSLRIHQMCRVKKNV